MAEKIKAGKQRGITIGYSQEYVADLEELQNRVKEFNIMRKSDSQVGAILRAIKLPIIRAEWDIKGGQEEIRKFIEYSFNNMNTTKSDLLRWALTHLDFGFAVFEKVFQYDESETKIIWRKFLFLPQETIKEIKTEQDGGIVEVVQYPEEPEGLIETEYIHIPVDYCLVFTNEREGDWYGTSIMRNAYGNWKVKDSLIKIDAIKHDRFGVGIPFMKLARGYDDRDVELARNVLSKMRSHEYGYMIIPPNVEEFGILEAKSAGTNVIESIRYHDEAISKSILAQFLDLGTSQSGNRALGESFIKLFLMSINTIADYIGGTFTKYAIKQLVDYNFGKQDEYPEWVHEKIRMDDIPELLKIIGELYKNGVIGLSPEDESIIRDRVGLPETKEILKKPEVKEVKKSGDIEGKEHLHGVLQFNEKGEPMYFRELAPVEEKINWKQYTEDLNRLENEFVVELKKYRDKQIKSLVYDIVNLEKEIHKVRPRYQDRYEEIIKEYQIKAFKMGVEQVKAEKKMQFIERGINEVKLYEFQNLPNDVLETIGINAQIGAEILSSRTKAYITNLFIQYKNEGLSNKEIAGKIYADTLGKGDKIIKEEFARVQNIWGQGRREYGLRDDEVKGAYYSAILDGNACDICASTDREYNAYHDKPFDVEFLSMVAPAPNPDCRGGAMCRCIWVYEYFVERGEDITPIPPELKTIKKKINKKKQLSLIEKIRSAKSVKDSEIFLKEVVGESTIVKLGKMNSTVSKYVTETIYHLTKVYNLKLDYIGIDSQLTTGELAERLARKTRYSKRQLDMFLKKMEQERMINYNGYYMNIGDGALVLTRSVFETFNERGAFTYISSFRPRILRTMLGTEKTRVKTVTHEFLHAIDFKIGNKNYGEELMNEISKKLPGETEDQWNRRVLRMEAELKGLMGEYYQTNKYEFFAETMGYYLTGYLDKKTVSEELFNAVDGFAKKLKLDKLRKTLTELNKKELAEYGHSNFDSVLTTNKNKVKQTLKNEGIR